MQSTMMRALSLNHLLDRAGTIFGTNTVVSRLPDKSLVRHSYAEFYRRTRALGSALQKLGLKKGDRVATLCWNHHAHLEAYFGIPAAGGMMHHAQPATGPGRDRLDRRMTRKTAS
ncbi:MAG: AMP-binding protein [Burkholderiaceae bacterium]